MEATSARFRLSEDDLEGFISGLWLALERHHLPSPDLHLDSRAGATTVELRFSRSGDLRRALESLTTKGGASASV
jgi:hypothetical protein